MNQEDAAGRLGIKQGTLSKIERGELPYNQDFLEQAARAYGCDVEDLLAVRPSNSSGEIKDRLKWARETAGFPRAVEAARAFGWTASTYLGNENGDRKPGRDRAEQYAKAFNVDLGWLLTGTGSPNVKHPQMASESHNLAGLDQIYKRILRRLEMTGQTANMASMAAGKADAIRNLKRAIKNKSARNGVSTGTIAALAPVLMTTSAWLLEGVGPEDASAQESQTPAQVALRLLEIVSAVEKKNITSGVQAGWTAADRAWVLDTYSECLRAALGLRQPHDPRS